ncbi:MAG TPA: tetratricopeptide repeat protein, partial [Blastocatellia bacterium]
SEGINELCHAQNQRPFRPWITGMEGYAPASDTRGAAAKQDAEQTRRSQIEQLLEDANEWHGTESEHALGEFYLINGDLDKAIPRLTTAEKADSKNAQYHNDLGIAFLQNNEAQNALNQFGEALRLDPSLKQALFNRALAYEKLRQPDRAEKAWQKYLENDKDSPWAGEARTGLKNLQESESPAVPSPER